MRIRLFALALMLSFAGCATSGKYLQVLRTWVNHDFDDLVEKWGPPDSEYHLNNGKTLYTYMRSGPAVGTTSYFPGTNAGTTVIGVLSCKTVFTVREDKTIERASFEGNDCVSN